MVLWWLLVSRSSNCHHHLLGSHERYYYVRAPRTRVSRRWMPVRSNSRRLGGSLYRWVVLRLLRRRLHPEGHTTRIKSSGSSSSNKHANSTSKKPQKQQQQQQQQPKTIRLCGGAHSTRGTGSPSLKENGKSPTHAFEENESQVNTEENYNASTGTISAIRSRRNNSFREVILQNAPIKKGSSLPEIETVKEQKAKDFCSAIHLEEESKANSILVVKQNVTVYDPQSHINLPDQGDGIGRKGRRRQCDTSEKLDSSGCVVEEDPSVDERTGDSASLHQDKCVPLRDCGSSNKVLKNAPKKSNPSSSAFPLLNVRGLEAGSVQSLIVPTPSVCQHINSLRRWDSISVLYGIEYLLVRKKVHERLLCILRERRERRLRRELRESILSDVRSKKRPHKRKRKKRKGKVKNEKKKDVKTKRKQGVSAEEDPTLVSPCPDQTVAGKEWKDESNEHSTTSGKRVNGEGKTRREENERQGKEESEVTKSRTRVDGSPSVGSGDSRPSRSPSYHQVTSSEKASSSSSSLASNAKSRETPTRDLSPGLTAHSSLKTVSSDTSSSASSSSEASLEEEEEDTSSASAKTTGGPSLLSTKLSPICDYISDDESASERRRSSFYCCPCLYTFKRKIKKIRRR